ncbi:MAG: DUF2693 domain-containing protein [Methanobrevibacter sp.]|nr:DUF2693 domain-containing protein [Methanobrevibacter sp.]
MNNLTAYENFIVEKKKTHHPFHGSLNREERNEFIERLQKNIIVFRYKKRDGSIRKAEGTLHPKFLPPAKSDKEFVRPEYQIVYYDIEKKSWRSFRSFEFVEILSTRPALSKREDEEEKKKKLKAKAEEESKKAKKEKDVDRDVENDEVDDNEEDDKKEEIDDRAKGEILKDRRKKKESDE